MKTILSRQNPLIKEAAALKLAKERKKQQRFIAEGFRTIKTLAERLTPLTLFATQEHLAQAQTIIDEQHLILVSESVMEKLSTSSSAPGMVGVFAIAAPTTAPLTAGLVLANVSNPGNMGTLIRTAAAMNTKTVVIVDGADPWSPKVIQASAGTIALVQLHQLSWSELVQKKGTLSLCALVVSGGKAPKELSFKDTLLVVGNEAHGLPDAWLADCDERCTIAMPGKTESLNAAVAGAIALYLLAQKQA